MAKRANRMRMTLPVALVEVIAAALVVAKRDLETKGYVHDPALDRAHDAIETRLVRHLAHGTSRKPSQARSPQAQSSLGL